MSIAEQSLTEGSASAVTNHDITVTVSSGTDLAITVDAFCEDRDAGLPSVDSVTWDVGGVDEAFTEVHEAQYNYSGNDTQVISQWALPAPTPGTSKTLRVTWSESVPLAYVVVRVMTGVDQSAPFDPSSMATNTEAADDTPTLTLTTNNDNGWVLMGFVHRNHTAGYTPGSGVVEDADSAVGTRFRAWAGHVVTTTAGGYTIEATGTLAYPFVCAAYELNEATGGGTSAIAGTTAGTSTASGTLTGTGALAGNSAGVATGAGTLAGSGALAGAAAGVATASGTLTAAGALTGAAAGTSTAVGTLTGTGSLVGTAAGVATASGALTGTGALSGTAAGTSTAAVTFVAIVYIVDAILTDTAVYGAALSDATVHTVVLDDASVVDVAIALSTP